MTMKGFRVFLKLAIILPIILIADKVGAQDANCDYFQSVVLGQTYYVYSPNYPNSYNKGVTCRWQASCPANTVCRLNCPEINLPASTSCSGDRLLVSKTGDSALTGAEKYCGTGSLDIKSLSNSISVGLVSTPTSTGGKFLCTLTAESNNVTPPPQCDCGWKKTTRIVGGQQTGINEYPMMVALVDVTLKIVYCGAVIIDYNWVLTAAHCLSNQQVSNVGVLVGEHNLKLNDSPATSLIRAVQFIKHPQYVNGYDYDIGLVKTDTRIVYSDRVGPVCLPFKFSNTNFATANVEVLGWGTQSFAGADSDYLQKTTLKVVDQIACANTMGTVVNTRTLCTFASGKDACQHDSGGPVLYQDPSNGRLYHLGVVIGGYGCATSKPGLNTRVSQYLQWITANTPGAVFCQK